MGISYVNNLNFKFLILKVSFFAYKKFFLDILLEKININV